MKRLLLPLLLLSVALAPGCSSESPVVPENLTTTTTTDLARTSGEMDIVDTAVTAKFTELVKAVQAAGLEDDLRSEGPFTVFAPNNKAFEALPADLVRRLFQPENEEKLQQLLLYHVIQAEIFSDALEPEQSVPTLEGSNVVVRKEKDAVTVNGVSVIMADVPASNGVIHVINEVLVPEGFMLNEEPTPERDIVETAVDRGFKTLVAAVTAANLGGDLSGDGPLTVFAPTEDAFKKLPKGLLDRLLEPDNVDKLRQILLYHVVSGAILSDQLEPRQSVATLEGSDVVVTKEDGVVRVNESTVVAADVLASNGVIHAIDCVLIPEGFTLDDDEDKGDIVDVAIRNEFATLVEAVQAAGLEDDLRSEGPFTVFAPTEGAFEKLPDGVLEALLMPKNVEKLRSVLLYHVLSGEFFRDDLRHYQEVATLEGSEVVIRKDRRDRVKVNDSKVVAADVDASNGVIHAIDCVLIPPGFTLDPDPELDIIDTALAAEFTKLAEALTAADLVDDLRADGPFTVFAPTNEAFHDLPRGLRRWLMKDDNRDILQRVLLYHVLEGAVFRDDLDRFQRVETLEGSKVYIANPRRGKIRVGFARVLEEDIRATNGVIHVINRVLIPLSIFYHYEQDTGVALDMTR